jgi:uncharacterized membrane protein HdeD (DUF308 family)
MKEKKILNALLYMIIGAVLCIMKGELIGIAMTVIGVVAIVVGIIDLCKKFIVSGVVKIVFGAFVIYAGWLLVEVILYVIAAILIIQGIIRLIRVLTNLKRLNVALIVIFLVEALLTLGMGICIIFYRAETISWVFIVAGVLLIVEGILSLFDKSKKR